jgi:poly(hydroxyalkanoate) depolymerase family esterase
LFRSQSQKALNMDHPLYREMLEATRLTKAGRLNEATAVLQRALLSGGTSAPNASSGAPSAANHPGSSSALTIPQSMNGKPSTAAAHIDARDPDSEVPAMTAANVRSNVSVGLRALFQRIGSKTGLHRLVQPAAVSTRDIVPDGGQFLAKTYGNEVGSLAYKLYIPSGYDGQALPLVVMLHGCTQSPDDFAAGTRMNRIAEECVCFVAYPEQSTTANISKCWNWFRPTDQRRGEGEPSLIAGITRQIMRDYSVDPRRIYIAGLSAGAAAAAIMGRSYPDLFAAIGVHSGLACGSASDIASAFAAMRQGEIALHMEAGDVSNSRADERIIPTIVFHGDRDATVHPHNGDRVITQWTTIADLETKVERGCVPGGHAYTRTVHVGASGEALLEQWDIHESGHAWSGGSPTGTFTDPRGPDASREMMRFFLEHTHSG